jgi:hypothetical protein
LFLAGDSAGVYSLLTSTSLTTRSVTAQSVLLPPNQITTALTSGTEGRVAYDSTRKTLVQAVGTGINDWKPLATQEYVAAAVAAAVVDLVSSDGSVTSIVKITAADYALLDPADPATAYLIVG